MLNWRPYKSKCYTVRAVRLTSDNVEEIYNYLRGNVDYIYLVKSKVIMRGGVSVSVGDYLVERDGKYFIEIDSMFKMNYCPEDISDEDKKIWKCSSTVVKKRCDTADEAIAETRKMLERK